MTSRAQFRRLVRRVIFVGDTDPSRQSYNAALDPAALREVLGSGVEIVLVGSACYARPAWVEALFGESGGAGAASAHGDDHAGGAASSCGGGAAQALRALGSLDPYSMCYDPLALLFHLQPDAFTCDAAPVPFRVSGDVGTAEGWRFERCEAEDEPHGYVIEPSAVSLERYAAFLREASRRT